MRQKCSKYSCEDISRFVDNELLEDQYQHLEQHLEHCIHCRTLVKHYKTISTQFKTFIDRKTVQADPVKVKQKLSIQNSKTKSFEGNFNQRNILSILRIKNFFQRNNWGNRWFSGEHYLKLASVALLLIITIFTFQEKLFTPSGPSAIVKYIDTDFASVMIMETQNKQHTIIWYSET